MNIIHRISIASSPSVRSELARLGVDVADQGFITFEVDESLPKWPELQDWIKRRGAVDFVSTRFSPKEVSDARWLELVPDWHHGYPQPDEGSFGFREATYDLESWCSRCGLGMRQVRPFQMKGEPKWGRRSIVQLNWIYDEFFVTPEAWERVFKPHGVGCRAVLNRNESELTSVVQLVTACEVDVETSGLTYEEPLCVACNRTKYLPVARGYFPYVRDEPGVSFLKTKQYFGSGSSAHRRVIISRALAASISSAKLLGASFRPTRTRVQV